MSKLSVPLIDTKDRFMALHTDIPTRSQIERLMAHRSPSSVSIYLPTSRLNQEAQRNRLELRGLADTAVAQLRAAGVDDADVTNIEDALLAIVEDDDFWNYQADSLGVFVTPTNAQTYRLANELTAMVEVSDRFHLKPLLRAVTFPQAAYVLALAQGGARLLEIDSASAPEQVRVADLPRDAWDSQGNKIFKARERNFARRVEHALRDVLNGSDLPLILAATETIDALYRTVNTYPHLAETRNAGNPETTSDADLALAARSILDQVYADQLAQIKELFDVRSSQGRAATDISDVARLATMGAVDTVLVDIDDSVPGSVDEATGQVSFADANDASSYGVVDEIARRVYLASGRVLAVRRQDIPGGGSVAAILRYTP